MTKSFQMLFAALCVALQVNAQCNLTTTVNQMGIPTCADTELAFLGYATGGCSVQVEYVYSWNAFTSDAQGNLVAYPELTIQDTAMSGTTFAQFIVPIAYAVNAIGLTVIAIDAAGVPVGTASASLESFNLPQPIVVTASLANNSCGSPNCLGQVVANGGTAPYMYMISDGSVLTPGTLNCFDVSGTYVITAVDANGCGGSTSFEIASTGTSNEICEDAVNLENSVLTNDTLCALAFESPSCNAAINYMQYGWYAFNSGDFTHANVSFFSGYYTSAANYNQPSAFEVYESVLGAPCSQSTLVHCQNVTADGACVDLASVFTLQPNTVYYIKYYTQWTTAVPLQALVVLTNESIAPICGCTDNTSCNYDPEALISNGSCGWSGCMDSGACNYQQWVTCDNGSCVYGADINGHIFHDVNGDGIQQLYQPGEPNLSNIGVISIDELGVLIYPDASGNFTLPDVPQATYTVSFSDPNGYWVLPSGGAIQLTLPTCNGLNLPLVPSTAAMAQISGMSVSANTTIHCAVGFNPGIYIYNNGNTPLNGTFIMAYNPSLVYTNAPWAGNGVTVVNPINTAPGELTWTINNQPPGTVYYYEVHFNGPGTAATGQSYTFNLDLNLTDGNGGSFYSNAWTINPTVTCSYDPNDISATPEGWSDQHFIMAGEEIEYRIRFQNTGNAPAFNVRIEDQLDLTRLDLNTFNPIAASHSYSTIVTPDGMVQFVFANIQLADSVHDEVNSHGWVVYRIRAFDLLQPLEVINNSAAIYFDMNDPVMTNIYSHTIFSCDLMPFPNGSGSTCQGTSVMLNVWPELDYTENYLWYIDGNLVGNTLSYTFAAEQEGVYDIVLNRTNPLCNVYDTLQVEVFPTPSNAITVVADMLVAPDGTNWQWQINNELSEFITQSITPVVSGTYVVTTFNAYGCTSESDPISITINGVDEGLASRLSMYPNPADDHVFINLPVGMHSANVYNSMGELVESIQQVQGKLMLDVSNWSAGMYHVEVNGMHSANLMVR